MIWIIIWHYFCCKASLPPPPQILASVSHDDVVKFWDVSYVFDEDSEGDADAPEVDIQALVGGIQTQKI